MLDHKQWNNVDFFVYHSFFLMLSDFWREASYFYFYLPLPFLFLCLSFVGAEGAEDILTCFFSCLTSTCFFCEQCFAMLSPLVICVLRLIFCEVLYGTLWKKTYWSKDVKHPYKPLLLPISKSKTPFFKKKFPDIILWIFIRSICFGLCLHADKSGSFMEKWLSCNLGIFVPACSYQIV